MKYEIALKKQLKEFELSCELKGDAGWLGIMGPSGSGKSFMLKCIAGIENADDGVIRIGEDVLWDRQQRIHLAPQMRNCGYMFQDFALFPNMTVYQNIACGLKMDAKRRKELVDEVIGTFHLTELKDRYPMKLSGGQQQRAALARMIVRRPRAILLDEPFSALDNILRKQLIDNLKEYLKDYKGLVILVSHNSNDIYTLCDHVAIIDRGSFISEGTTAEVFNHPVNERAALLTAL